MKVLFFYLFHLCNNMLFICIIISIFTLGEAFVKLYMLVVDHLIDWLIDLVEQDVHLSYNLYLLALYMLFCLLVFLWTEFD